jgi:hypothetical protein
MLRSRAVPWLVVIGALILPAFHIALAQDAKEPSIQLEKGNFWEYKVKKGKEKTTAKAEVVKYEKPGLFKVKATNMYWPEQVGTWRIDENCLVWVIAKGKNWKTEWNVWKFDAKQNDSWRSTLNVMEIHGSIEPPKPYVEMVSRVVGVEDVQTPAGEFKSCLKVKNVTVADPGMRVDPDSERDAYMWWAKGVGLVKAISTNLSGAVTTTWTLTSYKVGHEISNKKLKKMVKECDVVALVSVPKDVTSDQKVQVKLTAVYKGDAKLHEGKITISLPKESKKAKGFKQGEFIVFLKKKDKGLVLSSCAAKTDSQLLDRITKLLKSADEKPESLKKLTKRAEIIVGAEVVAFEKRESFNFSVVKVIAALKGTKRGNHLYVLS